MYHIVSQADLKRVQKAVAPDSSLGKDASELVHEIIYNFTLHLINTKNQVTSLIKKQKSTFAQDLMHHHNNVMKKYNENNPAELFYELNYKRFASNMKKHDPSISDEKCTTIAIIIEFMISSLFTTTTYIKRLKRSHLIIHINENKGLKAMCKGMYLET